MNMIEALKAISKNKDMWARPISRVGTGDAYCVEGNGHVLLVPSSYGGRLAYMPRLREIIEDWEVVEPGIVRGENE